MFVTIKIKYALCLIYLINTRMVVKSAREFSVFSLRLDASMRLSDSMTTCACDPRGEYLVVLYTRGSPQQVKPICRGARGQRFVRRNPSVPSEI